MKPSFLVLCLACVVLGAFLASSLRKLQSSRRARAQNARGKRGERRAERLLEAHGYRICARQLRTSYALEVDREAESVELVLDFVVERRGERFVAEVKSSAECARLAHAETRRQLLEYQLATGVARVLLVDAERELIREVAFPIAGARARLVLWPWAALLLVVGVLALWPHLR